VPLVHVHHREVPEVRKHHHESMSLFEFETIPLYTKSDTWVEA
jgi:hypothetical protein